ncbi:TonB-dependent receptor [Aurantibacter crassamenti]|uniref:TonB-dependent receptor n=1 Tax=Aurantibacter crassamenti TaxID=1837375 RepID=UPI00193A0CAC|nr:TonB-dependent receptor [Aurantibacter crassamenti]MBM1106899.1 TonB-dependent receptor [Aurantibacter crassamenti]
MRTYAIALFAIIAACNINAQDCNSILLGEIIDFHDNTPLHNATVLLTGTTKSVVTGLNGKFRIENLCDGYIELEVYHEECKTKLITVLIDGDTYQEISLEHHLEELEEVKIVGSSIQNKTNSALEQTLKLETIEQYSSQSIGDALKEINGVSSLNTGANIVKPSIHGLNGSRVLVLNDGVRMQDMEWGEEHAPNIDINGSGSIAVIKGAAALQYGGDAIGGVIVIEQPKFKEQDTLFGKTVINGVTNGRGGNISSELTKVFENGFFIKGQGSLKRLGDREAPNYILSNTSSQEKAGKINFGKLLFNWGFNVKYSYFESDLAILRASHIGNVDDLIQSINSQEPAIIESFTYDIESPRQEVAHHIGSLNFYKRFQGLGKLNVQYDFQKNRRFEYDIRVGDDANKASIDLDLTTHTFSSDFKWDSEYKYKLHTGVMGRYQDNFANPDTGVRRLIPDYKKYDVGLFLIGEYRFSDNLTVDGGLRYDYNRIDAKKFYRTSRWEERGYDEQFQDIVIDDLGTQLLTNPIFDYHNLSGTLGMEYQVDNSSTLRFNYALGQRAPNPSELFSDGLHHSAARIELGDLRIKSETSHKFSVSKEADYDLWAYSFEPYVNFLSDFILLEPTGVEFTLRGAFPVWSYRQTTARIVGFDASIYSNFWKNWSTSHKFSLVKGKDLDFDKALINIPAANFRNKVSFNRPKWSDFEISLESNYVFRQNEFPEDIIVFSPEQQQDVLLQINTTPPAYHLLSAYSKMQFPIGQKNQLQVSLTVNNLLNTAYRDYLNRQRYFADDLGRNFIVQFNFKY